MNYPPQLWSFLRLLTLMAALTVILWTNADDFDITEIKSLAAYFLAAASLEGGSQFLKNMKGTGHGENRTTGSGNSETP